MAENQNLIKKFNAEQQKQKILDLAADGQTYNEIATQTGCTRKYIQDTIKIELAKASPPEKILAVRNEQNLQLAAQTPKLTKRFVKQIDLTERLIARYEKLIEEEERGETTYDHHYNMAMIDGLDREEADKYATKQYNLYKAERESIAREMERCSVLGDKHHQTLMKHYERIARLNGADMPIQQNILVHRTDDIKVSLERQIKEKQKEIEAQKIVEAEIIDE